MAELHRRELLQGTIYRIKLLSFEITLMNNNVRHLIIWCREVMVVELRKLQTLSMDTWFVGATASQIARLSNTICIKEILLDWLITWMIKSYPCYYGFITVFRLMQALAVAKTSQKLNLVRIVHQWLQWSCGTSGLGFIWCYWSWSSHVTCIRLWRWLFGQSYIKLL